MDQQRRRECCGPIRQQVERPRPLGAVEQERRCMMEAARASAEAEAARVREAALLGLGRPC